MRMVLVCLAALAFTGVAQARCHFLCSIRHPVVTKEYQHHVRVCTSASCEARHEVKKNRNEPSVKVHHKTDPIYPCVIHWTYDGVRWWRLHYLVGGSLNHVGLGPSNTRTCLPGQ